LVSYPSERRRTGACGAISGERRAVSISVALVPSLGEELCIDENEELVEDAVRATSLLKGTIERGEPSS
jgi:hypothetical protein